MDDSNYPFSGRDRYGIAVSSRKGTREGPIYRWNCAC